MVSSAGKLLQPFVQDALAASNVGAWDNDVLANVLRCDRVMAGLYGFSEVDGLRGIPIERVVSAVHPADLTLVRSRRQDLLLKGGLFFLEYRTVPALGDVRCVLARGRYETDEVGRVVRGRGIVIDVTESRREGYVEGDAFFLDGPCIDETPLDRAARHAIDASYAIDELGSRRFPRLRVTLDDFLLELGRQLSQT